MGTKNEWEMELVNLLKRIKEHVETTYDIEVQTLRIEINDEGTLKFFSGDDLADNYLLEIDLDKEKLIYDDIVSCLEGEYDPEIREELIKKIYEDIFPNKTTEELQEIIKRG